MTVRRVRLWPIRFGLRAASFRRARQEAVIPRKRHIRHGDGTRQYMHALSIHDLALVRRPGGRHGARFRDGQAESESVAQLDPVEEQDVVDERADLTPVIVDMPSISGFS